MTMEVDAMTTMTINATSVDALDGIAQSTTNPSYYAYSSASKPGLLFHTDREFAAPCVSSAASTASANNFLKGVQVSPDGLCVLTNSEDNVLRLFETAYGDEKALQPAADQSPASILQAKEGGAVYDFAWYPYMTSQDPATCIFVSTSRDHPVHMWDAYNGQLRATYRAFDHLVEITAGYSVAFNGTADKIFVGYDRAIRYFDISQPSRDFQTRALCKTRRSRRGQRGIISSIHFNPDHSRIYAAGSYSGSTCIYSEDTGEELLAIRDHDGKGITQVRFSVDGRYLFTAARKDARIQCWDIRQTREIVHTFHRLADTNQRMAFDLHCAGRYLATGSQDGKVLLYDLTTGDLVDDRVRLPDAANGVSFFPDAYRARVAVSSGQRHFDLHDNLDDEDSDSEHQAALTASSSEAAVRNVLRVYEYGADVPNDTVAP